MDIISLNGQLLPYDDARIAPGDAGMLHGAGLFETMRSRNGKVFRLADHLARIADSARTLGLEFSLSETELAELVNDLLEANDLSANKEARLRLTLTRGDMHAVTAEEPTPPLTLLLTASAFTPYNPALYEKGMTVIASTYRQSPHHPLTGHKSTSYFDRLLALRQSNAAGGGEALWFTPDNFLAEASISNVFIVDKDGTLATPPLTVTPSSNTTDPAAAPLPPLRLCLPGITRKLVLDLATAANILPHERLLTINDLLAAKEIFLTNAIMGLMPVTHIEKHEVANARPGPLTTQLRTAYLNRFHAETE